MNTKSRILRACICSALISACYMSAFAAQINDEEMSRVGGAA